MKIIFSSLLLFSLQFCFLPLPSQVQATQQAIINKQAPLANREVAFTIDDLPGVLDGDTDNPLERLQVMNRQILNILKQNKIPAIGFVNESRLYARNETDARIAILRSWLDAGLTLGNHTFAHLDYNTVSLLQFEDEVIRGEVVTRALMRERGYGKFYLRFPFNHTGDTREKKEGLESFLRERNYHIAPFTIEHSDYIFSRAYAKAKQKGDEKLAERIRLNYLDFLDTAFAYYEQKSQEILSYEPKQIFLIHVNQLNADCLSEMAQRLKNRGYSFISLEVALTDKAYQTRDDYATKFGVSWLFRWAKTLNKKTDRSQEPDPPQFVLDLYNAN